MQVCDDMADAREMSLAAVAFRNEAERRGGYAALSAAQLHALVSPGRDWPRSGEELAARVLPALAKRPGFRGLTVRKADGGTWELYAAPTSKAGRAA